MPWVRLFLVENLLYISVFFEKGFLTGRFLMYEKEWANKSQYYFRPKPSFILTLINKKLNQFILGQNNSFWDASKPYFLNDNTRIIHYML